ncbi:MAG TPA: methyltransferase domain-containing protein, partial [Trueperaceae bacterium]
MPVILSRRDAAARELMDRPDCDPDMLATTYRNFAKVNRLFAAWRRVYLRLLRPLLRPGVPATLLDIGCGGGDVVRTLDRWATADGLCLRVTGIDPDPRAAAFLAAGPVQANVRYFAATAAELATRGERYDFVISNNVLHHLPPGRLAAFCRHSRVLCRQRVIHNDIRRGDLAYVLFGLLTGPFFRGSF